MRRWGINRRRAAIASAWAVTMGMTTAVAPAPVSAVPGTPPITGQVTFLYYQDLEKAAAFYRNVLGLEATFELDWVKIFRVTAGGSVGLVNATEGLIRPSDNKPVMVSLVVEDVDAWYEYLREKKVEIPKPPEDASKVSVRSFVFHDPEGYTLEVFSWRDR